MSGRTTVAINSDLKSKNSRRRHAPGKSRARTGCQTCRTRKIKCDEGRPSCNRCVQTGRVCDGYGIWGGGGNPPTRRSPVDSKCAPTTSTGSWDAPILTYKVQNEEARSLDWFLHRTVFKMSGLFGSRFWTNLVLQASSNEPAVLHSILALSSIHKRREFDGQYPSHGDSIPDQQERFVLKQYGKAISHLQPHFSTTAKASSRIPLIACLLFVYIELLRGHPKAAYTHLLNGLKVLGDNSYHLRACGTESPISKTCNKSYVDDWIIEPFSRLFIQVELFDQSSRYSPHPLLQPFEPTLPKLTTFQSHTHARYHLEQLLSRIFHLSNIYSNDSHPQDIAFSPRLLDDQQRILLELKSWFSIMKASKSHLLAQPTMQNKFSYSLLQSYYYMANIMANTCLWPTQQLIFDLHSQDFLSIITQSIEMWQIFASSVANHKMPAHSENKCNFIPDMGLIPPLYYTAIKCRIHRVRLHAIRMIDADAHTEGIWDSKLIASIAREVMQMEEEGFYENSPVVDNDSFNLFTAPEEQDFLSPALPESNRIHDVRVALPNDSLHKMTLKTRRILFDSSCEEIVKDYDIPSQSWTTTARRQI